MNTKSKKRQATHLLTFSLCQKNHQSLKQQKVATNPSQPHSKHHLTYSFYALHTRSFNICSSLPQVITLPSNGRLGQIPLLKFSTLHQRCLFTTKKF